MVIVRVANVLFVSLSLSVSPCLSCIYLALKCRDVFHRFACLFFSPFFLPSFLLREKRSTGIVLFYLILTYRHEKRFSRVRVHVSIIGDLRNRIRSWRSLNNLAQIFVHL